MRKLSDYHEETTMSRSKNITKKLSRTLAGILLLSLVTQNVCAGNYYPPPRHEGGGGSGGLIGGAIGGAILLGGLAWWWLNREPSLQSPDSRLVDQLKHSGPQVPPAFALNSFSIKGLVKGNWPMVMDFSLDSPGKVQVAISAQGAQEVYTFTLSNNQTGRRQMKWELPGKLGDDLRPALITVTATEAYQTGKVFNISGFGVGPRAVGSVAIDQLMFSPDGIHIANRDIALYRFFSHSNFENASAEFRQLGAGNYNILVNSQPIEGGVNANRWIGDAERRSWDGFDTHHQISLGRHRLLVRAWHSEGDWVTSMSNMTVNVSQ